MLVVGVSAQLGPSGIVNPDGVNRQFSHDFANTIVLIGPSGAVTSTGENIQLTAEQAALHAGSPPAPMPVVHMMTQPLGSFGPSGIVYPDGVNTQFTSEQADNVVLIGPSGVVTKDGNNIQLTDEGVPTHRIKRGLPLKGSSGYIAPDGTLYQLPHGVTVVVAGPSGAVLSNGDHIQH